MSFTYTVTLPVRDQTVLFLSSLLAAAADELAGGTVQQTAINDSPNSTSS